MEEKQMVIYTVPNGYDKKKHPEVIRVRDLTIEEARALSGHADFISRDGTLRTVKINGAVHTWKRDATRIEVPVKYGMYEYGHFHWQEAINGLNEGLISDVPSIRIVKRIDE
jgi:hypothetical protein